MQTFESMSRLTARVIYDQVMQETTGEKFTWPVEGVYGDPTSTDTYQYRMAKYSDLGLAHKRKPGRPILSEDIVELGEVTLNVEEIALGTNMDIRMLEDLEQVPRRKYMKNAMRALRESFKHTLSAMAAYPLNEAFSSTNQTVWDGFALCDSTRTLYNGESYSNDFGTKPVSFAVAWDMMDKLAYQQKTQKGRTKRDKMVLHVVHDSKRRFMPRIWEQEYEADTLTRNVNTLRGKGVKVLYCLELDDTGAQFGFTEEGRKNMIFRMRKKFTSTDEVVNRTRTLSVFAHQRVMFGVLGFEGIVGAEGS